MHQPLSFYLTTRATTCCPIPSASHHAFTVLQTFYEHIRTALSAPPTITKQHHQLHTIHSLLMNTLDSAVQLLTSTNRNICRLNLSKLRRTHRHYLHSREPSQSSSVPNCQPSQRMLLMALAERKLFRPWDTEQERPPSPRAQEPSASGQNFITSPIIPQPISPSPINTLNLWTSLFLNRGNCVPPSIDGFSQYFYRHRMPTFNSLSSQQTLSTSSTALTSMPPNDTRYQPTSQISTPPSSQCSLKPKRQRPKRFRCPHCQIAFSNNGQLKGHIRTHTGRFLLSSNQLVLFRIVTAQSTCMYSPS